MFEKVTDEVKSLMEYDGVITETDAKLLDDIIASIPDSIPERLVTHIPGNDKLGKLTIFGQLHRPPKGIETSKIIQEIVARTQALTLEGILAMRPDMIFLEGQKIGAPFAMSDSDGMRKRQFEHVFLNFDPKSLTTDQKILLYGLGAAIGAVFIPDAVFDGIEREPDMNVTLVRRYISGEIGQQELDKLRREGDRSVVHDIRSRMAKRPGRHVALVMGTLHDYAPFFERMKQSHRPVVTIIQWPRMVIAMILQSLSKLPDEESRDRFVQAQLAIVRDAKLLEEFKKMEWEKAERKP